MRVNLHTHSNISDGIKTPYEVIEELFQSGVELCSLTDHDKIDGILEAKNAALSKGIKFITGIEFSTKIPYLYTDFFDPNHNSIHLLGLGFDYDKLAQMFEEKKEKKISVLRTLNETLIQHGYAIPLLEQNTKKTKLADLLVQHGYANTTLDAFESIINRFLNRFDDNLDIFEVCRMIHEAEGKVIWAHPYEILYDMLKVNLDEASIDSLANELKKAGVDGIEVYYLPYSKEQINYLKKLQTKYHFIASAGTDYHGKPSVMKKYIEIDPSLIAEVIR